MPRKIGANCAEIIRNYRYYNWQHSQYSWIIILAATILFLFLQVTHANQPLGPFMPIIGPTEPPQGHVEFCKENSTLCNTLEPTPLVVRLTKSRWRELTTINNQVNKSIAPVSDKELYGTSEYWTFPSLGTGDCEEYVLEKQRRLHAIGWPSSALLITVVKDMNNTGHAVLTVRTDQGDIILDNQTKDILPWYSTPYRYVKRQSARHPAKWSAISDKRVTTVASIPR
ncbi:transglutaminase-like cysteine peptidase [Polycladidibacter stylochi]|uniref:transglutaminase-like cysteine peptidase n=1 Tax=Polycladidibacter stylochi TaxID=1807766 RepID=UPI00082C863B|nr:transglutaminase-like cysteine peptidase [Pseudovibrio stylochi]